MSVRSPLGESDVYRAKQYQAEHRIEQALKTQFALEGARKRRETLENQRQEDLVARAAVRDAKLRTIENEKAQEAACIVESTRKAEQEWLKRNSSVFSRVDPMRHTYITGGASTAVAFATQLKALEDDLRKKSGGSSSNFGSRYLHVPISSLEGSPSGGSDRHASKRLSDIGKRLFQSPGGSVAAPLSTGAPSKSPSHRGDQQCALEPRPSFTFDTMSPPTVGDTSALRPPTSFAVQTSWHAPRSCPQMGRRPRVTVRDVSAILEDDESSTLDVSPILPTRQLDKRSTGHSNTVIGSVATSPPKFSYHFGPSGGGDAVSSPTTMAAGDGVSGKITALPQASPFSLLSQRKRLQPVAFTA